MSASLALTLRRLMQGKGQNVAYTGTAGTVAKALPQQANAVLVWCTTDAYVAVVGASDGVASTVDIPIPANAMAILPLERVTSPGTDPNLWVSAVRISASGTMYIMPMVD